MNEICPRAVSNFLTLLLLLLAFPLWAASERQALVIGNAAYENQTQLVNTLNDVQDVAAKLEGLGFEVTKVENAGRRELARDVNGFIRRVKGSDGVALVYYSGHGLQVNGRNYLVPVDARIKDELDVPTEGLAVDRLLAGLGERGEKAVNLVILDSCRDNPYKRTDQKSIGDKGLARVNTPSGTLILYATKPGETASDNPGGRNGLFTKHLLAALGEEGVQVESAFKQVAREVYRESRKAQYPWLEGLILGQFYFLPPPPPGALPPPGAVPPPPAPAMLSGHLQINVNVAASVSVDGKAVGQAKPGKPLNVPNLPVGEHRVAVSADGYEPKGETYKVESNQWTQVIVTLDGNDAAVLAPSAADAAPAMIDEGQSAKTLDKRARQEIEAKMVRIRGGCFQMGSSASEKSKYVEGPWSQYVEYDNEPRHEVCVEDFAISKHEVTVAEFRRFVDTTSYKTDAERTASNKRVCIGYVPNHSGSFVELQKLRRWANWRKPSKTRENRDDDPVRCVNWVDAMAYVAWLNRETDGEYRLPTDAEWEYAARAGTTTVWFWGDAASEACLYANVLDRSVKPGSTWSRDPFECSDVHALVSPVGSYRANGWGLFDMLGNVAEWTCSVYFDVRAP